MLLDADRVAFRRVEAMATQRAARAAAFALAGTRHRLGTASEQSRPERSAATQAHANETHRSYLRSDRFLFESQVPTRTPQAEEDAPGGVSRRDGSGGSVEVAAGPDRAVLSGGWPWPASVPAGDDAAGAPDAELVRVERPGDGRGALRDHADAGVRRVDADEGDSGRDDDPELPAPAGGERAGAGDPVGG